jgi:crotonobetainyl-CoA:carnitine CoA-transferase CaiB-like acyl-CoA transferase
VRGAIGRRTFEENLTIIAAHRLTAQAVQTIRDIEQDPHWQASHLLVDVPDGDRTARMHTAIPRLSETTGEIRTVGGALGANNEDVFVRELGLDATEVARLREAGVI